MARVRFSNIEIKINIKIQKEGKSKVHICGECKTKAVMSKI